MIRESYSISSNVKSLFDGYCVANGFKRTNMLNLLINDYFEFTSRMKNKIFGLKLSDKPERIIKVNFSLEKENVEKIKALAAETEYDESKIFEAILSFTLSTKGYVTNDYEGADAGLVQAYTALLDKYEELRKQYELLIEERKKDEK